MRDRDTWYYVYVGLLVQVKSLRLIGHPYLITMLGFCSELKCFVYEHIEYSRSLHEVIKQKLEWHDRIRVARDICSALCHIKRARFEPNQHIVPGYLSASNILIDRNLRAKVDTVLKRRDDKQDFVWDVNTFGYLLLNILTGIPGNFISYSYVRCVGLLNALDKTAGQWPMDLAEKLMNVCRRCVDCNPRDELRKKYIMVIIVKEVNEIIEKVSRIEVWYNSQMYSSPNWRIFILVQINLYLSMKGEYNSRAMYER
ncbi:hypothetical protein ACLB2K_001596 [Fragaria x ananassa]